MLVAAVLIARVLGPSVPDLRAQACSEPDRVSRAEILQAMSAHGAYSLTSTTTSMRFGAEALLAIVRRRQRESPESTQLLIPQSDWFAAHRETAGVTYAAMSAAARAGFEHHQDALVDYGPQVVEGVVEGPAPNMALDVTIFWPDSEGAAAEFSYKDTLSVPRMDVYDSRVIRFNLLEYDSMLVFDRVTGISVRPVGFLSAVFAVLGKPDLKQTRIAVSGRPMAGGAGPGEGVRGHLEDRHGDDRAGRTRPRRRTTRSSGPCCPGGAHEATAQAPLRGTLVSGSAEDGPPRRRRTRKPPARNGDGSGCALTRTRGAAGRGAVTSGLNCPRPR